METDKQSLSGKAASAEDVIFIPPIPLLPPDALEDAYDEEDIRLDNLCAQASATTLDPADDPDNG